MKRKLRQFFFGSSLGDSKILNTGWLLFRLHIGLSIAIHAGWPKMNSISAPGWFTDQVAALGFSFPSPAFWAAMASWGEFVGGICIAVGLLTRFAALQLAFQFFVISFLWYEAPEPLTGMYFQQTLFWGFVLVAFAGGGRFSLDKLIMNKKKLQVTVPVKTAVASLFLLIGLNSQAQRGPLNGSGNVVTKKIDEKNFDKIELKDLAGTATIEVGKPFSIEIDIDDNLEKLLSVKVNNGKLKIEFEGNQNNKMYIENTNVSVRISLPEISVLEHSGNNQLVVNGITGRYFRLEKTGNGDAVLNGSIDNLDIEKSGNGDVNASGLTAQDAAIRSSGNGDVVVNAAKTFSASGSGNGDIKNTGTALATSQSSKSGNGDIIDASYKAKENPYPNHENDKKIITRIKNNTSSRVALKIVYPVKGNYGIDVAPGDTRREYFPLGTKIYKDGKKKELLFEITPENRDTVLVIE